MGLDASLKFTYMPSENESLKKKNENKTKNPKLPATAFKKQTSKTNKNPPKILAASPMIK